MWGGDRIRGGVRIRGVIIWQGCRKLAQHLLKLTVIKWTGYCSHDLVRETPKNIMILSVRNVVKNSSIVTSTDL